MTSENNQSVNNSCGCLLKLIRPCTNFLAHLNVGCPIHPIEPAAPDHSEFVVISSKIKIRVIHVTPIHAQIQIPPAYRSPTPRNSINKKRNTNSLSEEYWFTRWNKPLKIGNCNCSFRRSLCYPALSNTLPELVDSGINAFDFDVHLNARSKVRLSTRERPPVRIVNVHTYVERLIEETFFEAFQEYFMQQHAQWTTGQGVDNPTYRNTEVVAEDVVLRRKRRNILQNTSNAISLSIEDVVVEQPVQNSQNLFIRNTGCDHLKTAKSKPFLLLLHGIGCSADIWWTVIDNMLINGFEVVAPDMLGHGFSSAPNKSSAYTFQNLLNHTMAVLDHYAGCDSSKKCIVIGHSYGCSLATALYKCRTQQIVQLILISGGGPTPLAPPVDDNEISILGCLQTVLKPLLLCGLKRSLFYSSRGKHLGVCDSDAAVPAYVLKYIAKGQSWPEGDAAFHRRILVPTLLVHGLKDTQITLVQECEMERAIPRSFLELIPNAGHLSMLDTPEHLTHMILCFIEWWIH